MSQIPTEFTLNGWKFKRITPNCNHYIVYLEPAAFTDSALPMTGAAVTKQLRIPYPHRINKIAFTHLVAAKTLGTDALTIEFGCKQGQHDSIPYYEDLLLKVTATTDSTSLEVFGEAYEFEARTWTLSLDTTNTDLVIPVFYIQLVGTGGYGS
jgi:hypothetical protein